MKKFFNFFKAISNIKLLYFCTVLTVFLSLLSLSLSLKFKPALSKKTQNLAFKELSRETIEKTKKIQTFNQELIKVAENKQAVQKELEKALSEPKSEKELTQIAQARKELMLDLLQDSPKAFIDNSLPSQVREKLPEEAKRLIEAPKVVEGKFLNIHVDGREGKDSKSIYYLDESNSKNLSANTHQVFFSGEPKLNGANKLKISALSLDKDLIVNTIDETQTQVLSTQENKTTSNQKVAVLLVDFESTKSASVTKEEIKQVMFTDKSSVSNYYLENSYSKLKLAGDVFGTFTVKFSPDQYCSNIFSDLVPKAWDKASESGIYLGNYDFVTVYTPYLWNGRCAGIGGMGSIGKTQDIAFNWINDVSTPHTFAHELGHNLGLAHANFVDCKGKSVTKRLEGCDYVEYGDSTDVMGLHNSNTYQFNAPHKKALGWIPESKIKQASISGTYKISRLEDQSSDLPQTLILKRNDAYDGYMDNYFISYRTPLGFDSNIDKAYFPYSKYKTGANIHIHSSNLKYGPSDPTLRVDTSPTSDSYEANLADGEEFKDDVNGIKVKQLSHDDQSLTLDITYGEALCINKSPEVKTTPSILSTAPGKTLTYKVSVKNTSVKECPASKFLINTHVWGSGSPYEYGQELTDWSIDTPLQEIKLDPGSSTNFEIQVTSPKTQASGSYMIDVVVENSAEQYLDGSSSVRYFIFDPVVSIDSFSPTQARAGEEVEIRGKNFGNDKGEVTFMNSYPLTGDSITYWSDSKIKVTAPEFAGTGKIIVTTSDRKTALSTDDFIYINDSKPISMNPDSGSEGSEVALSGLPTYFTYLSEFNKEKFYFGNLEAQLIERAGTEAKIKVPKGARNGKVILRRGEDIYTTSTDFKVLNTINIKLNGAVSNTSDAKEQNRFSATSCPGKNYITDSRIKVVSSQLGEAKWDCGPGFYFGDSSSSIVNLTPGKQTFTITPPPGFTCVWYAAYGDKNEESFNGCTISINFPESTKESFLWFFLERLSSPVPSPQPAPVVTKVDPDNGSGGAYIWIEGKNFGSQKGTVLFNGVEGKVLQWSDTYFSVLVPDNTTNGPLVIQLPGGVKVTALDNFKINQPKIKYKVTGAVALSNTDSVGSNRFSGTVCPGKNYKSDTQIKISNPELGEAKWDCADPGFYFGSDINSQIEVNPGYQTFTITPPAGYKCTWYAAYNDKDSESFEGCTIKVYLTKPAGELFLWFFLNPK